MEDLGAFGYLYILYLRSRDHLMIIIQEPLLKKIYKVPVSTRIRSSVEKKQSWHSRRVSSRMKEMTLT